MKLWPRKKQANMVSYEEYKKLLDIVAEQQRRIERLEKENKLLRTENAELRKLLGRDTPPPQCRPE